MPGTVYITAADGNVYEFENIAHLIHDTTPEATENVVIPGGCGDYLIVDRSKVLAIVARDVTDA